MKYLFILTVCLLSCAKTPQRVDNADSSEFSVIEIDGCEYIYYDRGFGDVRVYGITHKGNCKNKIHCKN